MERPHETRGPSLMFLLPNGPEFGHHHAMAAGKRWTREELLVALNLYHKLPFGQFHSENPTIIDLARALGRSSSSLAMKLSNFASLDPTLKLRGIKGLDGASALDRSTWIEFHANLEESVPASEAAVRKLFRVGGTAELQVLPGEGFKISGRRVWGATDVLANTKVRRGQEYFREAVLNNFGGRCGVSRLCIRQLLIASHIMPWSNYPSHRLDVRNGLCLSRLHDAAFDCGLISFDENLRLILSPKLNYQLSQRSVRDNFAAYAGEPLHLPEDSVPPEPSFLATHREMIFEK